MAIENSDSIIRNPFFFGRYFLYVSFPIELFTKMEHFGLAEEIKISFEI